MGATQTVVGGHRRCRFMEGVNDDGYTPEELDFLRAMDEYKRLHRRPFPTWAEVLAVAWARGWRKVAEPGPLPAAIDGRCGRPRHHQPEAPARDTAD